MNENIKIGVLGGDLRQAWLCSMIAEAGFETAVWGLRSAADKMGGAVKCAKAEDCVRYADAVILPLPISRDGVHLNSPLCDSSSLELSHLLDMIGKQTLLVGGNADEGFIREVRRRNIRFVDYYDREELQIKNAIPSAEGALEIAMGLLDRTVFESRCAVVGYGRIGKVLSKMLAALGARVTVCARKSTDIAWARTSGYSTLDISNEASLDALAGQDVIFNTAPARLFGRERLEKIGENTVYIDLVSDPHGVDTRAAEELGITAKKALSLPGKVAPASAAEIICQSLMTILRDEGIIKGEMR